MPRAIVDPDEVRHFASFLISAANGVREQQSNVKSDYDQLKDVWKDQKYQQFDKLYEAAMKQLEQFLENAEDYSRFLRRKAEKAQRYLDGAY